MMEVRIDSGIDVTTISVLRQDPRNSRIISPVRQAAIAPSRSTPVMAARTKTLWSNRKSTLRLLRQARLNLGHELAHAASTTASVEALPLRQDGQQRRMRGRRVARGWSED